jgi:hypothetical protein
VIVVDGEPVTPGDGQDGPAAQVRAAQLEVRLCQALLALDPPADVMSSASGRIHRALRTLRDHDAPYEGSRDPASLTDDELREAFRIVRALRALPVWASTLHAGRVGFAAIIGGYALDIADELDKRAGRDG